MSGAYSQDLRDRVIAAVEREGLSRRAAARRGAAPATSSAAATAPPPATRVLLIEDDAALTRTLGDMFRAVGYHVESTRSGSLGLNRIVDGAFDLVILDPPAFAKNRDAKHNAINGYKNLNIAALNQMKSGKNRAFYLSLP